MPDDKTILHGSFRQNGTVAIGNQGAICPVIGTESKARDAGSTYQRMSAN